MPGALWVIDLPSEKLHRLNVSVPDDGTRTGPRYADASKAIRDQDTAQDTDYALWPNGKRAIFSARGDLFTAPAEHGATRNLTGTSNADEDHPGWSPDGKTIAYTTDVSGEQQIAVRPATGGAEKILTHFTAGFLYGLTHGYELATCGRLASLGAAEVISHLGARPAEVLAELARPVLGG